MLFAQQQQMQYEDEEGANIGSDGDGQDYGNEINI